jgi:hypothetical protein
VFCVDDFHRTKTDIRSFHYEFFGRSRERKDITQPQLVFDSSPPCGISSICVLVDSERHKSSHIGVCRGFGERKKNTWHCSFCHFDRRGKYTDFDGRKKDAERKKREEFLYLVGSGDRYIQGPRAGVRRVNDDDAHTHPIPRPLTLPLQDPKLQYHFFLYTYYKICTTPNTSVLPTPPFTQSSPLRPSTPSTRHSHSPYSSNSTPPLSAQSPQHFGH